MDFDDDSSSGHFSSRFRQHDPAAGVPGAAPNFSRVLIPEILTYSGRNSAFANVFRNPDQAIRESLENARFMRNDPSIMECLEARQRAVALLHWHIEPEDQENPHHKRLADDMTDVLSRIPRFTEYRRNLLEAIWYGRHACQNVFAIANIKGQQRVIVYRWLPVHGDKLLFRWDDGTGRYVDGQVGVRTTTLGPLTDPLAGDRVTEMSDQGPAYFFKPWERSMLTVHKHIIEDGAYEDALSAGRIHGVGIRDRIYWCWFQKQETMAQLMEVIERTGTGFTIYYYEYGNPASKAAVREVAENQTKSNIILMPRAPGDEHSGPPMQRIEPNTAAINTLQQIVHEFFEHQIKRYIMGQILSSESAATGLGSGVADLHQDTFYQIVNADAVNLEETITTELLAPLTRYNFPVSADNVRLYFRLNTKDAQAQQRLAAYKTGWEMGLKIKATDVYDVIGASLPKKNDEVLANAHGGAGRSNSAESPHLKSATVADMPAGAAGTPPQPMEEAEHYAKRRLRYWSEVEEAEHPRGQPENAGEFRRKDQPSDVSAALSVPSSDGPSQQTANPAATSDKGSGQPSSRKGGQATSAENGSVDSKVAADSGDQEARQAFEKILEKEFLYNTSLRNQDAIYRAARERWFNEWWLPRHPEIAKGLKNAKYGPDTYAIFLGDKRLSDVIREMQEAAGTHALSGANLAAMAILMQSATQAADRHRGKLNAANRHHLEKGSPYVYTVDDIRNLRTMKWLASEPAWFRNLFLALAPAGINPNPYNLDNMMTVLAPFAALAAGANDRAIAMSERELRAQMGLFFKLPPPNNAAPPALPTGPKRPDTSSIAATKNESAAPTAAVSTKDNSKKPPDSVPKSDSKAATQPPSNSKKDADSQKPVAEPKSNRKATEDELVPVTEEASTGGGGKSRGSNTSKDKPNTNEEKNEPPNPRPVPDKDDPPDFSQLGEKILFRIKRGDRKGRPFGTPQNPRSPTLAEFNPRIGEVRAADLQSIAIRKHGSNPDQHASVSKMSNEELLRFRPNDPMSATGTTSQMSVTGGHHRMAEIARRVASGQLPPDTKVRILFHD